jgi:hypothetical protein
MRLGRVDAVSDSVYFVVVESRAGFIMRTLAEIRSSLSTISLAISTAAIIWPMAGKGMNTTSTFFIPKKYFVAKLLFMLCLNDFRTYNYI